MIETKIRCLWPFDTDFSTFSEIKKNQEKENFSKSVSLVGRELSF